MKTIAKKIKDIVVPLVSTPESHDTEVIAILDEMNTEQIIQHFFDWMLTMDEVTDRVAMNNMTKLSENLGTFSLVRPENLEIGIVASSSKDQILTVSEITNNFLTKDVDLIIYLNASQQDTTEVSFNKNDNVLVIDKKWLASIIVEKNLPFFAQLGGRRYNRNLLKTA